MKEQKVEVKEEKNEKKSNESKTETKDEKKILLNPNAKSFIPKPKPPTIPAGLQTQNMNATPQTNYIPSNIANENMYRMANPQIPGMVPSQGMMMPQNFPNQAMGGFQQVPPQFMNQPMQGGFQPNFQNPNSAYANPQNFNPNIISTSQQINPYELPNLYIQTYASIIPPNIHDPNFDPYQYPEFVKTYKSEFKRIFLGNDPYAFLYKGLFHQMFGPIQDLILECFEEEHKEDPLADYIEEEDEEYDRKNKKKDKKMKGNKDQDDSEPATKKEKKPKPIKEKPKKIVRLDEDEDKIDLSKLTLDEVDETRKPISACLFGHVDCGKSTTCGSIMLCANKVDIRLIQKYEKLAKENNRESWWLAYIMDLDEEERAKGKTIEVGRANFETPTKRYTIFDAPGHANYVPNMIMGAAMSDIGGLVISAKKGEFESGFEKGGQTVEHAILARCLGIEKLIILVNKMDENTVKWSKERFEQIKHDLLQFLKKFYEEKNITFIPISGLKSQNIAFRMDKGICDWYDGPCLFELFDLTEAPFRNDTGNLRIPVMDRIRISGLFIFGKVIQGTAKIGSKVMVMPSKEIYEIQAILNDIDHLIPYAKSGENIKFKLKGLEDENFISRGNIICGGDAQCPIFDTFKAKIEVARLIKEKPIIAKGYNCIMHIHSAAEDVEFLEVEEIDPKTKAKKPNKYLKEGTVGECIIKVSKPICGEKADINPFLGKFTLRDAGITIAFGSIFKYKPIEK